MLGAEAVNLSVNKPGARLVSNKEGGLKGRDWLEYIYNKIDFNKFKDDIIVKKFIEYYEKYNLTVIDNNIVGIKMNDRPVIKDPKFMLKEWKLMFNQHDEIKLQQYIEESNEFIEYNKTVKK